MLCSAFELTKFNHRQYFICQKPKWVSFIIFKLKNGKYAREMQQYTHDGLRVSFRVRPDCIPFHVELTECLLDARHYDNNKGLIFILAKSHWQLWGRMDMQGTNRVRKTGCCCPNKCLRELRHWRRDTDLETDSVQLNIMAE